MKPEQRVGNFVQLLETRILMKLRNGFVSNSSSSCFIIRGIRILRTELAEKIGINPKEHEDLFDPIWNWAIKNQLKAEDDYSYFDREKSDYCFLGFSQIDDGLELDGVITELPEPDDGLIRAKLTEKIGEFSIPIRTYFQYISNDNY